MARDVLEPLLAIARTQAPLRDTIVPATDVFPPITAPGAARPAGTSPAPGQGRRAHRTLPPVRWARLSTSGPVPLMAILGVQAALSLRLVHLDTAFADEALYLWAGHQDWANLLHGTPMPPFPTYLSGSPAVYPPLGALADSLGGLAGARLLSLGFMLMATVLLWLTGCRLYGRTAAFFAAALWALTGQTLRLGAFATYDPMACLLLVTGAYCAVRAGQSAKHGTQWAMLTAAALTVANCAKYATGLFDPVVICLVFVVALTVNPDRKNAMRLGAVAVSYLVILLTVLLAVATARNGYYATGIAATTTARASAGQSAAFILGTIWPVVRIIGPLALLGVALSIRLDHNLPRRFLTAGLALTGTLAPLDQIRIHTATSLDKHEDFAAWFVALAAGYAVSVLKDGPTLRQAMIVAAAMTAIAVTVVTALPYARFADSYWPDSAGVLSAAIPLVEHTPGEVLFQNPSILNYYMGAASGWDGRWVRISGQGSLRLPSGRTVDDAPVGSFGIPGPFIAAIRQGYFKVIVLNRDSATNPFDAKVIPVVEHDRSYQLMAQAGDFLVWSYRPGQVTP